MTTGSRVITKYVSADGWKLDLYKTDYYNDDFISIKEEKYIKKVSSRMLYNGEIVEIDGKTESFVLFPGDNDIISINAEIRLDQSNFILAFNAKTLLLQNIICNDERTSRVESMLEMLTSMGCNLSFSLLNDLRKSKLFHFRWKVLMEISKRYPKEFMNMYDEILHDERHPEIKKSLEKIKVN